MKQELNSIVLDIIKLRKLLKKKKKNMKKKLWSDPYAQALEIQQIQNEINEKLSWVKPVLVKDDYVQTNLNVDSTILYMK